MKESNVVLCAPVRTAIGTYGGTLKGMPATELGAAAIAESLRRSGLTPEDVQSVVMGQVLQAGAKMNPARQAAIQAGLPVSSPAMTVNRVCGSGAQAVASAAQEVMLGLIDCAVAGGMENMDLAPYLDLNGRWGHRMGNAVDDQGHGHFGGQHQGVRGRTLAGVEPGGGRRGGTGQRRQGG